MKAAKKILASVGLELYRRGPAERVGRVMLEGALSQVLQAGLKPKTIFDVGAAYGATVHVFSRVFPGEQIVAIEALRAYAPSLEPIIEQHAHGQIVWAAGSDDGNVTFNVHQDLVGLSLYKEVEGEFVNGTEQTIPMVTLDTVARREGLEGPYFIKLDVQGAELDVLSGAGSILAQTDYLVLEVTLFKTLIDGPQMADVIAFLSERGFVCHDILDLLHKCSILVRCSIAS